MSRIEPHEIAAFVVLGLIEPERLPSIATHWVESSDSPAVAELASKPARSDPSELQELLVHVLYDLGIKLPSIATAAEVAKQYYAREVVAGRIDPELGAATIIYRIYADHADDTPPGAVWGEDFGISSLIGAYCQIDDYPQGSPVVAELRQEIMHACHVIANRADA